MKKLVYFVSLFVLLYSCSSDPTFLDLENDTIPRTKGPELSIDFNSEPYQMGEMIEGFITTSLNSGRLHVFCALGKDPEIQEEGEDGVKAGNDTYGLLSCELKDIPAIFVNVPGKWHCKAAVVSGRNVYYSDVEKLKVRFPYVDEMIENSDVSQHMESLWKEMINLADSTSRQEVGCWIYAKIDNQGELIYEFGNTEYGETTSGDIGTNASIAPSEPEDESYNDPTDRNIKFYVAYFHTHTPMYYLASGSRETGLSSSDINYAINKEVPVLLYDYSDKVIYAGHSLNASYELTYVQEIRERAMPKN